MTVLDHARAYVAAGFSVVPIRRDGSKAAAAKWEPYQKRLASADELRPWFDRPDPCGIALVGGTVSGNLEQLDFDREAAEIFPAWCELVDAEQPGLSDSLHVVETPGAGYHVKYRCPGVAIPGNQKLAIDPAAPADDRVLIETRGEGGYCVAPGSPAECHPSGGLYRHVGGPRFPEAIEPFQRAILLRCARSFNRDVKELPRPVGADMKPGEDFDRRGPDWAEILEPAGWKCVRGSAGGVRYWRRPGKDNAGWSATTDHCKGRDGCGLFKVFSANAAPFEDGPGYGKFRAFALLKHGGDLSSAADELAGQGFGARRGPRPFANGHTPNGHGKNGHAPTRQAEDGELEIPLPEPVAWPKEPGGAAYHGVLGDILELMAPHTEADPTAILVQLLVMFGNVIGRHAHWTVEADSHFGNLYCCLVGDTAAGRKGVSLGRALHAFDAVHDEWARTRIFSGLSSGEGLIWAVRDPIWTTHHIKQRGRIVDSQQVESDKGIADKRILIVETEFVRPLQAMQRKGNTLSAVLRQGWDQGNLASVTKNTPARATGAHVSIIGHITRAELERNLNNTEASNGFVNRFLWIASKRSRLLPLGGRRVDLGPLAHKVALAVEKAQLATEIGLDRGAEELFCQEIYPQLNRPAEGLLGAILARGPAQVRRLAMLYALLDFSDTVCVPHLRAALELWQYSERSCRWVFQQSGTGDRLADDVLDALKAARDRGGLTQYELQRQVFQTRVAAADIRRALAFLRDRGSIKVEEIKTGGRPAMKFCATSCAVSAVSAVSPSDQSP